MKILYCLKDSSRSGGMERSACSRLNYLADVLGYDITIVTTDRGKKENFFEFSPKIHFIDFSINYLEIKDYSQIKALYHQYRKRKLHKRKLAELIYRLNPDICISNFMYEFTLLAKIKANCIKIAEFHFCKPYRKIEIDLSSKSFLAKQRILLGEKNKYRYIKCYNAFVVLTEEDAARWEGFGNLRVIPNVLPFFPVQTSACTNKEVIAVGRLTPQKGFMYLLDAWKLVNNKYPDWQLKIYGEGELFSVLQKRIKELYLEESVTIRPFTQDLEEEYLQSSVYVMTSIYEGFGLSLVEAMSCGLPSVVYDCPSGPAEIVSNGIDGFVVEPKDVSSFADKLILLLEDQELRVKMGANARESSRRFLPENIMPKWVDLFSSL